MYVKGDLVEIVDESLLPTEYPRLLNRYKNGQRAIVVDDFYGYLLIRVDPKVSSITLSPDELLAIRKVREESDDDAL